MLRAFSFLGVKRRIFLLAWLLTCAELLTFFATPILYRELALLITEEGSRTSITTIFGMFAILLLLTPVITLGWYIKRSCTAYGTGEMRKAVFYHMQRLPLVTFNKRNQGDYISRLSTDITIASNVFNSFALTGLVRFVIFTGSSWLILLWLDWRFFLVGFLLSLWAIFVSVVFNPKVRFLELEALEETAQSTSFLMETLRALPIIRVFLLAPKLIEKYRIICKKVAKRRALSASLHGVTDGLIYVSCFCAQPIGFILGVVLVINGESSIPQVVFLAGIMGVMAEGLRNFSGFTRFIQPSLVASKRVFAILDEKIENEKIEDESDITSEEAISMENVTFSYDETPILKGLNLKVKKGETIAIVGSSGGGKTTLLKLLQGLFEHEKGHVKIFGKNIISVSSVNLRRIFSYVPQGASVYDCSIAENIGFGKENATQEEIEEAAKIASIHDFIISLPNGYNTKVNEQGTKISGGQRQRIAIARAVLRDAPILLLDEATSALDSEIEREVQASLNEYMREKTVLVVAHRLSTVINADRILIVEDGVVKEEGSHKTLLQTSEIYKTLYSKFISKK